MTHEEKLEERRRKDRIASLDRARRGIKPRKPRSESRLVAENFRKFEDRNRVDFCITPSPVNFGVET